MPFPPLSQNTESLLQSGQASDSQESLLKREDRISSEFPLDVAFLMTKLILTQQLLVEDNHQDKSRHISVPTLHLWQLLWPVLL